MRVVAELLVPKGRRTIVTFSIVKQNQQVINIKSPER